MDASSTSAAAETPRRLLSVAAAAFAVLAIAYWSPGAAQAQAGLPGEDCDFPVVEKTTDLTYECAGQSPEQPAGLADTTAVPTTRTCRRTFRTGTLRALAVNCGTARGVARRRSGRLRYRALGFSCRTSRSGIVTCRRAARTGAGGAVIQRAARVTFRPTRRA